MSKLGERFYTPHAEGRSAARSETRHNVRSVAQRVREGRATGLNCVAVVERARTSRKRHKRVVAVDARAAVRAVHGGASAARREARPLAGPHADAARACRVTSSAERSSADDEHERGRVRRHPPF